MARTPRTAPVCAVSNAGWQLHRNVRNQPILELTPREREVLGLMAEGRSNAAIAGRLFITEKAVSKHTNNIFSKLRLPHRPGTTTGVSWPCSPTSKGDDPAAVTSPPRSLRGL